MEGREGGELDKINKYIDRSGGVWTGETGLAPLS